MNVKKMYQSYLLVLGTFMTCMASDKSLRVPLYRNAILSNSRTSNDVPLNYSREGPFYEFYGIISAGTPPQDFTVVFDSGSADMWLVSAECNTQQCKKYHRYDHNKSSTYIENGTYFEYVYSKEVGNVTGFWSYDDVIVGGVKVKKQQFGEAKLRQLPPLGTDGVIGLSFNKDGVNTVMENMIQQHVIRKPVVSFYMSSHLQEEDQVGELVLGGSDPKHYIGELTYVPTVSTNHYFPNTWNIKLDGLYVNGKNFLPLAFPTMIDTGYNGFGGPPEVMDPLIKKLGADKYNISCSEVNKQPDIVFQFNGIKFPVKAKNYYKMIDGDTCQMNFYKNPEQYDKMFELGQMFIQQYYAEFDFGKRRIGFAPSK